MMQPNNRKPLNALNRARNPEHRATELLQEMAIRQAPVPVEHIALRMGLQVERAPLGDDVSGLLVVQDGRGVIGVSPNQAPVRQRFTIAHEIGHFVLHRKGLPVFIDKQFFKPYLAAFRNSKSSSGDDKLEREANSFAASLLMPADMVRQSIDDLHMDVADDDVVDELAKKFDVSRQAMSFRIANLANSPAPSKK